MDISYPSDETPENNILRLIAFISKCLLEVERRYSNIQWETLALLHGIEKFHHYCFAKEASMITDQKPLVAILQIWSHIVTEITVHTTQNSPIQSKHTT